jgi:hypothetical protein
MENPNQVIAVETRDIWKRGLLMLLLAIAFAVAQTVLNALAVLQFFWLLLKHEPNQHVARFGGSLSKWLGETALFLTCTTEDKPFPWRAWPQNS